MNDIERMHRALASTPLRDPGGVNLAWLSPGEVSARFMTSVLNLYMHDIAKGRPHQLLRPGTAYQMELSGPGIASARNDIVRTFLARFSSEWLLMMDADMVFEDDALEKLLESADKKHRPVVGGLCFGGGKGSIFPTMYRLQNPVEHEGVLFSYVNEWEEGELVRVDSTGAAFLLMHRDVLLRMASMHSEPAPWFSWCIYKGREFGEDWSFCLRLLQMEVPLYVNTAVKVGHEKTVIMNEAMWRGSSPLTAVGLADGQPDGPKLEVVGA